MALWSSLSAADRRDLIGLAMVTLGVAGDLIVLTEWFKKLLHIPFNPTNFGPLEFRKVIAEIVFSALIVFGLGLELTAWPQHIKEVVALQNENIKLKKEMQWRAISPQQITNFVMLTKGIPKFSVRVGTSQFNDEAFSYAVQIREMLDQAGYSTPISDTNCVGGVFLHQNVSAYDSNIGDTNGWIWLAFISDSTNKYTYWHYEYSTKTNGLYIFTVPKNDTNSIYSAFINCFQQLQITIGPHYLPAILGSNSCEIYVIQKSPNQFNSE